jgi:hypothetical protein
MATKFRLLFTPGWLILPGVSFQWEYRSKRISEDAKAFPATVELP